MTKTHVTAVCGPPGSGKSTYVQQHMTPGDLVVDLDHIMAALSLQPLHSNTTSVLEFAWEARDAVLDRLARENRCQRAWVIDSAPQLKRRAEYQHRFNADVVVLDLPLAVCEERLAQRPNSAPLIDVARTWWANYERS